jgi:hypothetical protein
MILRLAFVLLPELKDLARGLFIMGFGLLMFLAPIVGMHSQAWAGFWFGVRAEAPVVGAPADSDSLMPPAVSGAVTDVQRYQLARAAGFNAADAIIATALSIAENGSGNPAAMSGRNWNGTYDLGLWQVNTIWWAQFGGKEALVDPMTNARAAFYIYNRQGWCAWSTYERTCTSSHAGTYRLFLERARAASLYQSPGNQA